jgi:hypothetical protein
MSTKRVYFLVVVIDVSDEPVDQLYFGIEYGIFEKAPGRNAEPHLHLV